MIKVKFLIPFKDGLVAPKTFRTGEIAELTEEQYRYVVGSKREQVVTALFEEEAAPEPIAEPELVVIPDSIIKKVTRKANGKA